jgi:regulator of protease activity HflC (stomatin/prohibitin superfamily)
VESRYENTIERPAESKIITKDGVTITVDGFVQYKITDPETAIRNLGGVGVDANGIENAIKKLAQAAIKDTLGFHTAQEILEKRDALAKDLMEVAKKKVGDWGVELQLINLKDIVFEETMTRAMAKKAESARAAEAKVINAQADVETAKIYEQASAIYKNDPTAMRLRELEVFTRLASEKSNTFVLIPTQVLDTFKDMKKG